MRSVRRPVSIMLLLWYLPGCMVYESQPLSPAIDGKVARLSIRDSSGRAKTIRVKDLWVRGDSVGGKACIPLNPHQPYCEWQEWDTPLPSVHEVEVHRLSGPRTVLAGVVAAASIVALGIGITSTHPRTLTTTPSEDCRQGLGDPIPVCN
jgi:hypothetical protein